MRSAVPEDAVIFANDVYRFNYQRDYEYDVELFLGKVAEAKKATDIATKVKSLRAAFELYRGPYLPSEEALWAAGRELRQVYARSASNYRRCT